MTRRWVYGVGLTGFLPTLVLTLAAIVTPEWLIYRADIPDRKAVHHTYGLHEYCTATPNQLRTCTPFPTNRDCRSPTTSQHFCTLWRTAGFALSLAVILEFAAVIAFAITITGNKQKRVQGWRLVGTAIVAAALAQCVGWAIVAWEAGFEQRWREDWAVGKSFILAVVSAGVQFGVAFGVVGSRWWVEEEGGYELIPDRDVDGRPYD